MLPSDEMKMWHHNTMIQNKSSFNIQLKTTLFSIKIWTSNQYIAIVNAWLQNSPPPLIEKSKNICEEGTKDLLKKPTHSYE